MSQTLLPGITATSVVTDRLGANVLEKPAAGETTANTVVFVHGNVSSSLFWQPLMLALPGDVRALAIDLRGFGESETLPVDATRGVRDFSDDVASVLDALGLRAVDIVGWSMGGGVVMQMMLDRPDLIRTVTLQAPVSPYGFGGTTGADGRLITADGAGTGGGGANPDFVARLRSGDTSADEQTSPRTVYRTAYVVPGFESEFEDLWVESMLTTKTDPGNYPGDSVPSENWPGFAAGGAGVLNTMAPVHFTVSAIVDLPVKPPILWVRGENDAIVGDASFFDLNVLGQIGAIPGWPGDQVAPAQPMVTQTRAVFNRYRDGGGEVTEIVWPNVGHAPHLERQDDFVAALLEHVR